MSDINRVMKQALAFHRDGKLGQAEKIYRGVLARHPDHPDALHLLGTIAIETNNFSDAVMLIGKAISLSPSNVNFKFSLGRAYFRAREYEKAEQVFLEVLSLNPRDEETLNFIGMTCIKLERLEEAEKYLRRYIKYRPTALPPRNNLGMLLMNIGDYEGAKNEFLKIIRMDETHWMAWDNLLFLDSYHVLAGPDEIVDESSRWAETLHRHIRKSGGIRYSHENRKHQQSKLRIGYVSPDFKRHSVSYFMQPIVSAHDREKFEIFCYAEVDRPDHITRTYMEMVDGWRWTRNRSDQEVAAMIHDDQIDILVDLAGHTVGNRLGVFACKPAPVQVTYLGYFATTGLDEMDYWLTDRVLHPEGGVEKSVEEPFLLDRCCMAIDMPENTPDIEVERQGEIVFGSFNALSKIMPVTIERWAAILNEVEGARMLLKAKGLGDERAMARILSGFARYGINEDRLILKGWTASLGEHLAMYNEMDIALDVMPRTGGATTVESLWMGVPVITLAGDRFIERLSASMLEAVGLGELVASSPGEYIAFARALAGDRGRIAGYKATLRDQVRASSLCDGAGLAHSMERAYREMWARFSS